MSRHESSLETEEISFEALDRNHLLSLLHTLVEHLGGQVAIPLSKFLAATKKYNQFPITEETDARTGTIYLRAEKPRFRRVSADPQKLSGVPGVGSVSAPPALRLPPETRTLEDGLP